MKALLLLMFVVQQCSFTPSRQDGFTENKKRFNFGKYIVLTGSCNKGSGIEILESGKSVYYSCGGDGQFVEIDTMDINKDGMLDFVFAYAFDDYTNLGMLISTGSKNKYETISITDNLFKTLDCSVNPYQIDDKRLKDFVLTDTDNDGNKDILTMAIQNSDRSVSATGCSKTILYQQLLQKLKPQYRKTFNIN